MLKNYLKEILNFQNIIGVNCSFDFVSGRGFEFINTNKIVSSNNVNRENNNIKVNDNVNNKKKEEKVIVSFNDNDVYNESQDNNIKTTEAFVSDDCKDIREKIKDIQSIDELVKIIKNFNGCDLKRMANNDVIYDGNTDADVLLIGEAPGADEDEKGIPFVGQSGLLLRKALSFIKLNDNNLFITNLVFWRPPENRKPYIDEIKQCRPFLEKMIEIVKPKLIILCGSTAIENMLDIKTKLSDKLGVVVEKKLCNLDIKFFSVYHPSYLLRTPSAKKLFWQQLLALQKQIKDNNII